MKHLNIVSEKILSCAIEVHRELGPGLLESIYESSLCIEMGMQGLVFERQKILPVSYKGQRVGNYIIDIVVENAIVLELKSVERFDAVFEAQLMSYMKLGGYHLGLLLNFNSRLLKNGIKRIVL